MACCAKGSCGHSCGMCMSIYCGFLCFVGIFFYACFWGLMYSDNLYLRDQWRKSSNAKNYDLWDKDGAPATASLITLAVRNNFYL